ncbi:hypothetical protein DICPUDRAFT_159774 [Dictyostelium purpureum]|uniref:Uncharacterized protein n=1 Tax=Dictyostelium purpureum TaxID=5786 RepID=F1A4Y8_DICPU|nr:uncharacterized protein DICPUDRAFT_159774 [Dictyostelium purpureum]EGC28741.1 hypothetical protein DICPUDRAFT_159774 [Dictyostelium purpureum]|eukprot:XP_003294731.1 hypothetical protein DICPUDRAFT_159774 [Dictyostelium purpureum]
MSTNLAKPTRLGDTKVYIVLEHATLETVKVKDSFQLLNCDDHSDILKKYNREASEARPDITHQCLLALFDSPLNKAGLLQVYIRTTKNVLIEVHPQTRIPRTFNRFAGLMVQLLKKLSIRATNGPDKLFKVIKNPITDHLPPGCKIFATSFSAPKCVDLFEFIPEAYGYDPLPVIPVSTTPTGVSVQSDSIQSLNSAGGAKIRSAGEGYYEGIEDDENDKEEEEEKNNKKDNKKRKQDESNEKDNKKQKTSNTTTTTTTTTSSKKEVKKPGLLNGLNQVCFVIGAMSTGSMKIDYKHEEIAFSNYPLSAAGACFKITTALEKQFGIL